MLLRKREAQLSVIFHIALGRMSTLRRILNTIIALRLVLINISLSLVLYFLNP